MLVVATLLLAALPLGAQEPGGPEMQGQRDEAFKIIDAYVLSNLQERVGLSDEQYLKVLPLVKKAQDDRRGFAQRRMRAIAALRQAFRAGRATDALVTEKLKELKDVEANEGPTLKRHREAIDATLDPVQQAKMRVMEVEVDQRIRQMMSRVREDGPRRRPGPGPGQRPD